jgi:putative acetyltransferase
MIIRREESTDISAIRKIVAAAFPTAGEAKLVDELRSDGDVAISMVAVVAGIVAGHVLLSKMKAPFRALGLAPVAVAPDLQGKGIGASLIRHALEHAERDGWEAVFVLGNPALYQKFGFTASAASGFSCDYAGPHFMVTSFGRPLPVSTGQIAYAPAFAKLG